MLVEAVSLLLAQLNQFIHQAEGTPPDTAGPAIWGNISQADHPDVATTLENQLVLTLVSVEEERTLKNGSAAVREESGALVYRNRPLHLNLNLLLTANYRNYETALKRLAQVFTFFQGKQRFTLGNSPGAAQGAAPGSELSLTLDLISLSLEEINHLWGSLGGKALPFALYRGRLVALSDRRVLAGGGLIQEIEVAGTGR